MLTKVEYIQDKKVRGTTQTTLSKPINLNGRTVGSHEVIKQKCFKCHERINQYVLETGWELLANAMCL